MPVPALITCIAGRGAALVAAAVLVGDRTAPDIGDDFHVAMRMGVESGMRRDTVIIDHQQLAKTHLLRIVIAGKAEMVLGIEPAMIGAAKTVEFMML